MVLCLKHHKVDGDGFVSCQSSVVGAPCDTSHAEKELDSLHSVNNTSECIPALPL